MQWMVHNMMRVSFVADISLRRATKPMIHFYRWLCESVTNTHAERVEEGDPLQTYRGHRSHSQCRRQGCCRPRGVSLNPYYLCPGRPSWNWWVRSDAWGFLAHTLSQRAAVVRRRVAWRMTRPTRSKTYGTEAYGTKSGGKGIFAVCATTTLVVREEVGHTATLKADMARHRERREYMKEMHCWRSCRRG